jgi:hypothetical protein
MCMFVNMYLFAATHAWIDPSNLQQFMIARWVIIMSTHCPIHVDNMTHYIIHRYMHACTHVCMYVCPPQDPSSLNLMPGSHYIQTLNKVAECMARTVCA